MLPARTCILPCIVLHSLISSAAALSAFDFVFCTCQNWFELASSAPIPPVALTQHRKPSTIWRGPLQKRADGVALSEPGSAIVPGNLCKMPFLNSSQWPIWHAELLAFADSQGITKDGEAAKIAESHLQSWIFVAPIALWDSC